MEVDCSFFLARLLILGFCIKVIQRSDNNECIMCGVELQYMKIEIPHEFSTSVYELDFAICDLWQWLDFVAGFYR